MIKKEDRYKKIYNLYYIINITYKYIIYYTIIMYLSIDVGIKNLAYIIYDTKIIQWKVIELCETNANKANIIDLCKKMFVLFEKEFTNMHFKEVIIENQIGPSAIRMKSLQGMITMYFINKNSDVVYWNSSNKLKRFTKKLTYKERKKLGILVTSCIINEFYIEQEEYFLKNKKKDDLADCFLQLLDYLVKKDIIKENIFTNAINIKL